MRRWHLDAVLSPSSVGHCLDGLGSFSAATTDCLIIYATVNETQMLRIAICHGTTTLPLPVVVSVASRSRISEGLGKTPEGTTWGKSCLVEGVNAQETEIANGTGTRLILRWFRVIHPGLKPVLMPSMAVVLL